MTNPTMRAKFHVASVEPNVYNGVKQSEKVRFSAVAKNSAYPADGSDEDNTYAKWSPMASCEITIANPALWDKLAPGAKFYVDFTEAAE